MDDLDRLMRQYGYEDVDDVDDIDMFDTRNENENKIISDFEYMMLRGNLKKFGITVPRDWTVAMKDKLYNDILHDWDSMKLSVDIPVSFDNVIACEIGDRIFRNNCRFSEVVTGDVGWIIVDGEMYTRKQVRGNLRRTRKIVVKRLKDVENCELVDRVKDFIKVALSVELKLINSVLNVVRIYSASAIIGNWERYIEGCERLNYKGGLGKWEWKDQRGKRKMGLMDYFNKIVSEV